MASRIVSEKQVQALLKLDGPKRYDHFIKHVVDCEQAWGLYKDGWAMGGDDSGTPTFPLWPAKEYAILCANGDWAACEPSEIPLDDLVEELLPNLDRDGVIPSIFRTPEGQAAMPTVELLLADLRNEMLRYE